jgi:hypothetical protein
MTQAPAHGGPLEERPLRELLAELSRDGSLLVRQELELAKKELGAKVERVEREAGSMAIGGTVCHLAAMALTAGLVLVLSRVVEPWLAAFLVAAALAGIGALLVSRSKKRLQQLPLNLDQTEQSVKRDIAALKEATHD